jgi:Abnormal spindle-like microcephaly-assoc'd, ASPM-SPD-2-Hydin
VKRFRLRPIWLTLFLATGCLLLLTACQGLAPANSGSSIALSTSSLNFGTVVVGSRKTLQETLSNTSTSSVTISQASVSGSGFSISGLTMPLTLTPSQSVSFSAVFASTAVGSSSGSLSIVANSSNSPIVIPLSATGLASGSLTANPASLAFDNVQVGTTGGMSETLTNSSGTSVTISSASVTDSAFSISGLTLPTTLNPNQSITFTTTFAPTSSGSAGGTLAVVSNASNSNLSIALSGTGTVAGQLSISPPSLNFGTVAVGSGSSLSASLSATGAAVTISSASSSSGEFVLSGITFPVTIPDGQSTPFTVTFTPSAGGTASANVTFVSNASKSPTSQSLSGTGQAQSHFVGLSWNPSSAAVSYNVYRKLSTSQNYTQIDWGDGETSYTDNNVVSGETYDYAVTAVNAENQESGYSKIAQAVIPNN